MKKLILLLLLPATVLASGFGVSTVGKQTVVTFQNYQRCDSVRIQLGFPDTSNWYKNGLMTAVGGTNQTQWIKSYAAGLDSIGGHVVRILYYVSGASYSMVGGWVSQDSTFAGSAGLGSGSGTFKDTLYIFDSLDSTAIADVSVTIRPIGGGTPFAFDTTNSSGYIVVDLNLDSYNYGLYKQGYDFSSLTRTIIGNENDTIFVHRFLPSFPSAGLCQVWGQILSQDTLRGTSVKATLVDSLGKQFSAANPAKLGAVMMSRFEFNATTKTSTWVISLAPNPDITPPKSKWKFNITYPDGTYLKDILYTVPDSLTNLFVW